MILSWAQDLHQELVSLRRKIHSWPELSYEEEDTSRLVAEKLRLLGIRPQKFGKTAVVGTLKEKSAFPVVALRADMDALPIPEKTGAEYASQRPGIMHACGHDAHTAMLWGAAVLLSRFQKEYGIDGNVKFIFQHAEEVPPGGARELIAGGVLENPRVDAIFGQHVNPFLPAGTIGWQEGTVMAAVDAFEITVYGEGGHGAFPHQAVDAVVAASAIIQSLQTIISRSIDPLSPAVITIGTITGGYKSNVIADRVKMTGTVRSLDPVLSKKIKEEIEIISKNTAAAYRAGCSVQYQEGYPLLKNDKKLINIVREAGIQLLSREKVKEMQSPGMFSEDFALYTQKVPGAYYYLGTGEVQKEPLPWHHPSFNIKEDILPLGTSVLVLSALRYLKNFK